MSSSLLAMVPLSSLRTSLSYPLLLNPTPPFSSLLPRFRTHHSSRTNFSISSISQDPYQFTSPNSRDPQNQKPPRTLFPGGYKRPEIKVPTFALQLDPDDVLGGENALDFIDKAVSKWVGIVVLNGGQTSGGKLYEAACKLKSVLGDRSYLLVTERVDIAASANASGVVLSDQGLPAVVARSTMMDSKIDSVVLPLVARNVETIDAALNASNSEGADFLIYNICKEEHVDSMIKSLLNNVKIPTFVMFPSYGEDISLTVASKLLRSGASGLVTSLEGFKMLGNDALSRLFDDASKLNKINKGEGSGVSKLQLLNMDNAVRAEKGVAGFIKLEDREQKLIERERSVLLEAIKVVQKASPLMEEVSLLIDAVSQIDEPFLLAIVVIVC